MHPLIITLFSAVLSAAAPHAINHVKLHEAAQALDIEPRVVKSPLVARQMVSAPHKNAHYKGEGLNVSPTGECGGSSGFQCAPGFCCSQYGYCGKGPGYCGGGSEGSSAPPPEYSAPPTYSSPAESGGAPPATYAPAPSSAAPAPSSYAPAPSPSSSPDSGGSSGGYGDVYKMYSGSGSPSQGWPSTSEWMDFDSLWEANLPLLQISCEQFDQADNTDQENNDLKAAIQKSASSSGLDDRFILAIVMQESKGCVRVWTTDNGVTNPGLMQSHDGSGSCNSDSGVLTPCPSGQIDQMIDDGVNGTPAGDGLAQCHSQCTGTDPAQKYYQAGTIYNSGNLPQNLDDNTATACYASDIANRLTGWTTAATKCTL